MTTSAEKNTSLGVLSWVKESMDSWGPVMLIT